MYWPAPLPAMNAEERFQDLLRQGMEAGRAGRSEAALALYAQASALVPASGIPHFLAGSEHAAAGATEPAEAAFANAVLLLPDFALARYQLGLLQFSGQRAAAALVTWGPLLALGPAASLGHFVRGFAAMAEGRFTDAVAHHEAGLACGDLNPAVGGDIRQVLQSLQGLAAPEPAAGHVLLAAYGRGLH